jgi:UDP-N-acetylmuramyl pentapeptide synthase
VVKQSAAAMAKKLGVPLEKYVQEMKKLEAKNG